MQNSAIRVCGLVGERHLRLRLAPHFANCTLRCQKSGHQSPGVPSAPEDLLARVLVRFPTCWRSDLCSVLTRCSQHTPSFDCPALKINHPKNGWHTAPLKSKKNRCVVANPSILHATKVLLSSLLCVIICFEIAPVWWNHIALEIMTFKIPIEVTINIHDISSISVSRLLTVQPLNPLVLSTS